MLNFVKIPFTIEQVFLTSDIHGYHKNIARGSSLWSKGYRDFNNQYEMTDYLIDNINRTVKESDCLIHCGDWSFGGKENIQKLRDRINCKTIYAIQGNHDQHISYGCSTFTNFQQIGFFKIEDINLVACHYPMSQWYNKNEGALHAFGHCHGMWEQEDRSLDVGVDNAYKILGDYRPFSFQEFCEIVTKKELIGIKRRT